MSLSEWFGRHRRFVVVAAQGIGQLSLVVVIPVLTRTYTSHDLGVYQVALAVGLILQPIATFRTEFVLPSLQHEHEFRRVRRIAITALLICLALCLVVALVANFASAEGLANITLMSAMLMVAYGWTAIDNAVLIRRGEVGRLAARNCMAGLLAAALQLLTLWVWMNPIALALSVLLGRAIAIGLTRVRGSSREVIEVPDGRPEWTYRRGLLAVASGIAASGASQSLVVYSTAAFGPASAAYVGVAQRSASAPLGLLSQGLAQATQAGIAPLIRAQDKRAGRAVDDQVKSLLPFSVAAVAALAILGPLLAEPIFGTGWGIVGTIILIIALPSGMQLLFAPVIPVFAMLGQERTLLVLQIVRLVSVVGIAALLQTLTGYFVWAVTGYSVASSVWYLVTFMILRRSLRRFGS